MEPGEGPGGPTLRRAASGEGTAGALIRVALPQDLRRLAGVDGEVCVQVSGAVTQRAVLDAVEASHPVLLGTIRDPLTQRRRAFLRLFACGEDHSHDPPDAPLPPPVATGAEPLRVVASIAGG